MKRYLLFLFISSALGWAVGAYGQQGQDAASWWLTTPDKSALLAPQPPLHFGRGERANSRNAGALTVITVDPLKKYQTMDGFGFALTGGSAEHLMAMTPRARKALLRTLFGRGEGRFGISYLRLSIGSSDLNDHTFSYDDMPPGKTDTALKYFDLAEDKKDVIPVLHEILAINPHIRILGSPWSAPVWMKTNHNIQGGHLQKRYYKVYAQYFARYVQAMKSHGITIDAVTVQNEPFNDGNTPSMQFFAKEELDFVKNYLGPLFRSRGITTRIVIYDHNCDAPQYPVSVLTDAGARQYIDGSAFHLYAGPISALTEVHEAFPHKNVYFTEYMIVNFGNAFTHIAGKVSRVIIGAARNWSRNVLLWNLAANSKFEPHTGNGGCTMCQGAVTIDGDSVTRNVACYAMGHFSAFVPAGSVRIASTPHDSLANVAFCTPEGKTVLVVANSKTEKTRFHVVYQGKEITPTLPAGSVATFKW
jgi:glucosylceramidase